MPEFTFHHGAVSVPDLDDAIDWYGRMLGFAVEKHFRIAPARARAVMLKKDNLRFEIFEVEDVAPLSEHRRHPLHDMKVAGNKHVAFRVENVDEVIEEMTAKGADIAFVVRENFGNGCFVRDCAGNLIEFVEEPNG